MQALLYSFKVILFSLLLLSVVHAQNNNTAEITLTMAIPSIALINFAVDGNQVITYGFSFLENNQIEQVITPSTNDHTWLNYSSIVNAGLTNYITIHISSGSLPADVLLYVSIAPDAGSGAGLTGTSVGQITLSTYPQNIITNIGSCYTGMGIYYGHQLTYIWENPESYLYSLNYGNGNDVMVTYTIISTE